MPRELINTGKDKRYVRRNPAGEFDSVVDVGRSLSQDRRTKAKRTVKAGEGDRGDQAPRKATAAGARTKKARRKSSTSSRARPTKAKAATKGRRWTRRIDWRSTSKARVPWRS